MASSTELKILFLSLALNVLIPLDTFLGTPRVQQVTFSCLLVFTPILFAGVIFAVSFSRSVVPNLAFGANIAGAMLGDPEFRRRDAPAEFWRYRADGCMLDAPTYPLFNTNVTGSVDMFDPKPELIRYAGQPLPPSVVSISRTPLLTASAAIQRAASRGVADPVGPRTEGLPERLGQPHLQAQALDV